MRKLLKESGATARFPRWAGLLSPVVGLWPAPTLKQNQVELETTEQHCSSVLRLSASKPIDRFHRIRALAGHRHHAFLALLFLSILTLWIEQYWPVALFLAGTFVLTATSLIISKPTFNSNSLARRMTVLLCVFPAMAGLQLYLHTTVYAENTVMALIGTLSYPCVIYLLSDLSPGRREQCQSAMLWFAFIVSVIAILQYFSSGGKIFWLWDAPDGNMRSMGPILSPNHWAVFIEAVLPIAIYRALRFRDSVWLYSTMAGALYASVIACASRSGAVLCTLELLIVPTLLLRRGPGVDTTIRVGRALLPVFGALVLLTLIVGPEAVIDRLMQPDPYFMRRDLIEPALTMFKEHSALGIGAGNWNVVYPQYATMDLGVFMNQAHNDWLQWAGEGGIMSIAAFGLIALIACSQAVRNPWAVGVPVVFCHAFVDYPFSRPALAAWTIGVVALSLSANMTRNRSASHTLTNISPNVFGYGLSKKFLN